MSKPKPAITDPTSAETLGLVHEAPPPLRDIGLAGLDLGSGRITDVGGGVLGSTRARD